MAGKAVGGRDLRCGGGRYSVELFKCAFIFRTPVVPHHISVIASILHLMITQVHSSSLFYILDLLLYSFTRTIVFSTFATT